MIGKRAFQVLLISSATYVSWLLMMLFHETGHIIIAIFTGAEIDSVRIHPLKISYTSFATNPKPILVGWGGATIGCVIPVVLYIISNLVRLNKLYLARYVTGLCLLFNGMYFLSGAVTDAGDVGVLIRLGVGYLPILIFGLVAVSAGIYFLNDLSPYFGFKESGSHVSHADAFLCTTIAGLLVSLMSYFQSM